ncbi:magnesium transporter [Arachidicoccus rhizosphaerae]|uniref:Magnesium transporter MgtE n=1 Tax=Arachidicoccus rhizosphaerae TaxID=551991 RepID=A0A1H3W849_9BACT|nr:magnesium transporter [Arachidicoccus rhizosphaerae]SDZ82458.1 magnesium transporter [Arachidicoccus rhizosphaerae]
MSEELEQNLIDAQFELLLFDKDAAKLQEFLNDQGISDVVALIDRYPENEAAIISNMAVHRASRVFKLLDISTQKSIIKELPPFKTAELLNQLSPDDRTDFLEELPKSALRDLIKLLNPEEVKITLRMLGYPEDSVGRLMTPDYIYVYETDTVAEAFRIIRKNGKNSETIDVIYVINKKGELVDDFRIRDLILASSDMKISELMDGRIIALNVNDDQEKAGHIFRMNNRVALPVVDDNNILLGIVTIDDILWVTNEEYSEDMQKMGGTEALDEPYLDTPFFKLIRKRAPWLIILFLSEMLTTSAMTHYSDELQNATVLALFIPLIMSSGGNSGSQASTLIIQAMAVGEVTIKDWWRIMRREILSGLTLGLILGIIGFLRISLWELLHNLGVWDITYGEHWLMIALTVGSALVGIILWGSLTGSMLPILLKKLGADPATSSAPFVATLVDVTGIIIYFVTAYLVMGQLIQSGALNIPTG